MLLSVIFSKPAPGSGEILERPYNKIRIFRNPSPIKGPKGEFMAEFFTDKQVFHKNMAENEVREFIGKHAGTTFRNVLERTDTEETTTLANKRGEIRRITKKISSPQMNMVKATGFNREKKYLIMEGKPVPFLVELGVMAADGKVIAKKHDKFRQINRFLEFIDDIAENLTGQKDDGQPLRIIDFGSGKSYLTFAVWHYFTEIKKVHVSITGLDLKKEVIENCSALAKKLGCTGLSFMTGDIKDYEEAEDIDLVITLHACDTATDYALEYAARKNARAILSVPCCQKEINMQIKEQKIPEGNPFRIFSKYGIIQERFSALVTDTVRAELLGQLGYSVQLLEFIDMEGTPKNLLIRAVKKNKGEKPRSSAEAPRILQELGVSQKLSELLKI